MEAPSSDTRSTRSLVVSFERSPWQKIPCFSGFARAGEAGWPVGDVGGVVGDPGCLGLDASLTDGGSAGAGGPAAVVARAMAGNYDQMGSIYCRAAVCRALPYEWFAYRVVIL